MNRTDGPAGAITIDTDAVYAQVRAAYHGELQAGLDDWARLLAVTAHTLQLAPEAGAVMSIAYYAALVHDVDRLTDATATSDATGAGTVAILTAAGLDRPCVEVIEQVLRDARAALVDPLPSPEARALSDAITSFDVRRVLAELAGAESTAADVAGRADDQADVDGRRRGVTTDALDEDACSGRAAAVALMEQLDPVLFRRAIYSPTLHADLLARVVAAALRPRRPGTQAPPRRRWFAWLERLAHRSSSLSEAGRRWRS